jgi:hypothetical protein
MELPERCDTGMNALGALEQFATDARVTHTAVVENRPRHSDRALGVVGGLTDAPLASGIADVPGDGRSWGSLESTDTVRIPSKHILTGQRLGLLSDGVAGCDPLQTAKNPPSNGSLRYDGQAVTMRFARIVFLIAGVWGIVVVTPLYFMFDAIGRNYPPPMTHADFYYGFIGVAIAWQLAFLVIAKDPVRFRLMMLPAMVEKFSYVATLTVLYAQGGLAVAQFALCGPDFVLGLLFVAAFFRTSPRT